MDGRDRTCRLLAGFLAADLDPAEARRWDEHLLECEACWRAVREDRTARQHRSHSSRCSSHRRASAGSRSPARNAASSRSWLSMAHPRLS